ncbi:hypothetical protein BYT27DRAFT_6958339 [Phlegmacium glaucopus]|nr:hypothetical protein BYT27DRAFT_6958339 [Phlegmacium glaucopus]
MALLYKWCRCRGRAGTGSGSGGGGGSGGRGGNIRLFEGRDTRPWTYKAKRRKLVSGMSMFTHP